MKHIRLYKTLLSFSCLLFATILILENNIDWWWPVTFIIMGIVFGYTEEK